MTQHRYEIFWRGIAVTITYEDDYSPAFRERYGEGIALLEISSRHPLPISETGYHAYYLCPEDMTEYPTPAAFAAQWLDCVADGEGWTGQLSLF